jgi:hypothetical protein
MRRNDLESRAIFNISYNIAYKILFTIQHHTILRTSYNIAYIIQYCVQYIVYNTAVYCSPRFLYYLADLLKWEFLTHGQTDEQTDGHL